MEEDEKNQNGGLVQNTANQVKDKAVKEGTKKARQKLTKEATKKVASGAAKKSMAAALAPVLFWVGVVVFAIIIIVGVVTFLMTMPGMAMSKLKEFAENVGDAIASYFGADSTKQVKDEEIYEVLDYLEDMGYDLKGYGFLTDYTDKEADGTLKDDEDDGVIRYDSGDNEGKIKDAESEYIFMYLVSDNYTYTVRNFNLNTQSSDHQGFLGAVFTTIKGYGARVLNSIVNRVTLGIVNNVAGDAWGRGMIAIYYEGGHIGERGGFYGNGLHNDPSNILELKWPFELNHIEVDAKEKKLKIKKGALGNEIEYDLEGWAGRYGMPMEFLLAIHLGTMMPDLAYDMATTFDTQVELLLHDVDGDEDTYQPYISRVLNHWYRDVYYVKDDGVNIVDYDVDYESYMKERWTRYETYEDGPLAGEYKLYAIDETGDFATSTAKIRNYDKASSKIKAENGYYLFEGTQEEAREYKIDVVKKAEIASLDDEEMENLKWNKDGGIWTAYEEKNGKIKQIGEGLRAETNKDIKRMFLHNSYFRYDGSADRAEVIKKFRDTKNINLGALDYKYDLSTSTDKLNDVSIKVDRDGKPHEYTLADVSGQVNINQDSLNAFSILENTHTLDTDYIYRDFKELIVELGYFTKEELTDETPRLLAWLVPNIGSYGYPNREIDKNDFDFGTMIHSKGDIDANVENTIRNLLDDPDYVEDGGFVDPDPSGDNPSTDNPNPSGNDPSTNPDPDGGGGVTTRNKVTPTGITLNKTEVILGYKGDEFQLVPVFEPSNATEKGVKWESNSPLVTVDSNGVVRNKITTSNDIIEATITCTSVSDPNVKVTCKVQAFPYTYGDENGGVGSDGTQPGNSGNGTVRYVNPDRESRDLLTTNDEVSLKSGNTLNQVVGSGLNTGNLEAGKVSHNVVGASGGPTFGVTYKIVDTSSSKDGGYSTDTEANGVTYHNYKQGRYGDSKPYTVNTTGPISSHGCSVTSASILLSGYGIEMTPPEVADTLGWSLGSNDRLASVALTQNGVEAEWFDCTGTEAYDKIVEACEQGIPVIPLMGPGGSVHWTGGGHFVTILGIKADGTPLVSNPGTEDPQRNDECPQQLSEMCQYMKGVAIPLEPPKPVSKEEGEPYVGYLGNEAVVSPVTGILLEYGTYSNDEDEKEERMNVDLKYEQSSLKLSDPVDGEGNPVEDGLEVIDKVGYAKIMVLDAENYRKLELSTNNSWKNDSLANFTNPKKDTFRDIDAVSEEDGTKDWSLIDKTVYGYKEFAERYTKGGIAGNIIYIDGFRCEDVDEELENQFDPDKRDDIAKEIPNGKPIEMDNFRVPEGSIDSDDEDAIRPNLFIPEDEYNALSKEQTIKINTEESLKTEAAPSIGINYDGKDLIFIKEGTVLGRTLTDKELLESGNYRNGQYGTYEDKREKEDEEGNIDAEVIGNYLRILFKDKDDVVISNVEDYMKLDQGTSKKKYDNDWELFYWLPFESGAADTKPYVNGQYTGPVSYSSCSSGEVAVGIIQETSLTSNGMCNQRDNFVPFFKENYPEHYKYLTIMDGKGADWYWSDFTGAKQVQAALKNADDADHEGFLHAQMEEAKEYYYKPLVEAHPWIEEKPSAVQAELLHLYVWGPVTCTNVDSVKNDNDKAILDWVRYKIANTSSTVGPGSGDTSTGRAWSEPEIGKGILDGKLTTDQVEEWVRTADINILAEHGIEYRGP